MYGISQTKKDELIISAANRFGLIDIFSLIKSNLNSKNLIIMYHRVKPEKDIWSIDTTDLITFEKQIRYLKKTHNIISLEKLTKAILEKKTLPKKTIVITFDDGYKDNFSYAFPILKKYKIPATIFLTTGYIGTNKIFWWDRVGYILNNSDLQKIDLGNITLSKYENKSQYIDIIIDEIKKMPDEKRKREINKIEESSKVKLPKNIGNDMFLTWDEVKEMSESKISFGAHTVNHPILTNITLKQAEIEIKKSKEDIEKRINTSVNTFSYPNGLIEDFNKEIIKILKKNGFICSVTAYPTMITKDTDLFELGRVPPGWSYDAFKFFISGIYLQKSFSNIMKTGI